MIMKRILAKTFLSGATAMLVAIIFAPLNVSAATIYSNFANDLQLNFAGNSSPFMYLGTGFDFVPTGLRVGGSTNSGTVGIQLTADFLCSTAAYPSFVPCAQNVSADPDVIPYTENGIIQFNFTAAPALDPSRHYYLSVNLATSIGVIWGSVDSDPNGFHYPCFGGVTCSVTSGYNSLYYEIAGVGGFSPPGPPRIISVSPNGQTLATTTVTLEADVFNDSATEVCFYLNNYDVLLTIPPICLPLFASGLTGVSTTTTLLAGYYLNNVQMIGGGTVATSSVTQSFTVIATNVSNNVSIPAAATTTESNAIWSTFQQILIAQNTPSVLQNAISQVRSAFEQKLPFSFFAQVRDQLNTLLSVTATSSDSDDLTVELPFYDGPLKIFSWDGAKTTLEAIIPPEAWVYVIYVAWFSTLCLLAYLGIKLLS